MGNKHLEEIVVNVHGCGMVTPDEALGLLRRIRTDFDDFCSKNGEVSEADTRAKIIDKILISVLGWPEPMVSRENHVERGFMDYCLEVSGKRFVCVEAKREGIPFVFPVNLRNRSYVLCGSVLTCAEVKEAILQVRGYCDDAGIRYAVATNGYAWIIFRSIREDVPWREGYAIVFTSIDDIIENFTRFWNLLSYNAICLGSLDSEFGSKLRVERKLSRVVDTLINADLPLQRNRLHLPLHPLIKTIFEDIADQDQIEILKSCYVHSESLKVVVQDLNLAITDTIPSFLKNEGTKPLKQDEQSAGEFGEMLSQSVKSDKGQLYLLLGGIGSGKTTFLKRYQRTVGKDLLDNHTIWFTINFLSAPLAQENLETFVWSTVLSALRTRYKSPHLETRRNIKRAFMDEILALEETSLSGYKKNGDAYERALSPHLEKWQSDVSVYVPRLLALCKPRQDTKVILFLDNVDQLSPTYQAQIFLLAQRVTRLIESITIVALREESYYTASVQKTFTAFTNRKFHIASPLFLKLVKNRISYSIKLLTSPPDLLRNTTENNDVSKTDIADYLKIVDNCISQNNKVLVNFIECLCFGNMRLALQMFTTFLASGVTDVDKMLRIYRRDGSYIIAFHEFVKSIMLGDRRYYKEMYSPVKNLFDCGLEKNSSHFTALRILYLLVQFRGQSTREGKGYLEIPKAAAFFEDTFDNREDFVRTMNRILSSQLIEVNTKSTENISDASHARITSSGWYYQRYLVKSFPYLDLILQDTPFNDPQVAKDLKDSIVRVDNFFDSEQNKMERLHERFSRVERFLDYLLREEQDEWTRYDLDKKKNLFSCEIVPYIRTQFIRQKEFILKRVEQNREKYNEDNFLEMSQEDQAILSNLFDQGTTTQEQLRGGEEGELSSEK